MMDNGSPARKIDDVEFRPHVLTPDAYPLTTGFSEMNLVKWKAHLLFRLGICIWRVWGRNTFFCSGD